MISQLQQSDEAQQCLVRPDGVACGDTQRGHGVVTPQVEDDALREKC